MDTEDHKYPTVCLISAQHGIQAMFALKHTHTLSNTEYALQVFEQFKNKNGRLNTHSYFGVHSM